MDGLDHISWDGFEASFLEQVGEKPPLINPTVKKKVVNRFRVEVVKLFVAVEDLEQWRAWAEPRMKKADCVKLSDLSTLLMEKVNIVVEEGQAALKKKSEELEKRNAEVEAWTTEQQQLLATGDAELIEARAISLKHN